MTHIAIITAKGSNQSIPNKNLLKIGSRTFLAHQIIAAQSAKEISDVFVSTEDELIKKESIKYEARIIQRPDILAQPHSNHGDTILHAYFAAKEIYPQIDTLTILLGNTIAARGEDIDANIALLREDTQATSAMTVWHAQDDHPYRAMQINDAGYLASFQQNEAGHFAPSTNRQSYPPVFFYDQGPWTVRGSVLEDAARGKRDGPACWWWMGNKCIPVVRNWVTGRDVHSQLDVAFSEYFLEKNLWSL